MRRLAIIALAMAVTASLCPTTPLAAEPVKTASQPWVTNKVEEAIADFSRSSATVEVEGISTNVDLSVVYAPPGTHLYCYTGIDGVKRWRIHTPEENFINPKKKEEENE